MKNLLAYLPALLIFLASCATPERCAQYCHGTDSTVITIHDTVIQVKIVADSAQATAPAPCPDIAPIYANTKNAKASAWVEDSTLHLDMTQGGTADVNAKYKDSMRTKYVYINIPCPEENIYKWKYYIGLSILGVFALIAVSSLFKR